MLTAALLHVRTEHLPPFALDICSSFTLKQQQEAGDRGGRCRVGVWERRRQLVPEALGGTYAPPYLFIARVISDDFPGRPPLRVFRPYRTDNRVGQLDQPEGRRGSCASSCGTVFRCSEILNTVIIIFSVVPVTVRTVTRGGA